VFATLSAKLSQDDVLLNEAIRNGPVLQEHVTRTKDAAMSGSPAAGLDFSAAWRWGLKLAQPNRRIVQVNRRRRVSIFSSPDSVYAVAQQYQIPNPDVVLDNGGCRPVKSVGAAGVPEGLCRRNRPVSVR